MKLSQVARSQDSHKADLDSFFKSLGFNLRKFANGCTPTLMTQKQDLRKPGQVGVVIPTYNRLSALLTCLKHLERQTFTDFEVIVIDDGSTHDTTERMAEYQQEGKLSLRYVRQDNGGPAKARNLGISMLDTPLCLLLGDDIFIAPTLLQSHVYKHAERPNINTAVVGLIRWNTTDQLVTPFMHWIDRDNMQFCYPLLLAGKKPDWTNFYTSNLSVKTDLLRMFPFDGAFPFAAMEDSELAYRIEKSVGLEVLFAPEALADHLHPTTFRQACVRRIRIGYSTHLFHDRWPEMRSPQSAGLALLVKRKIIASSTLLKICTELADAFTKLAGRERPTRHPQHRWRFKRFALLVGAPPRRAGPLVALAGSSEERRRRIRNNSRNSADLHSLSSTVKLLGFH